MGKYDWLWKDALEDETKYDEEPEPVKTLKTYEWVKLLTTQKTLLPNPDQRSEFPQWAVVHALGGNESLVEIASKMSCMRLPNDVAYLYLHDVLPNTYFDCTFRRATTMDATERLRIEIVSKHFECGTRDAMDYVSMNGEELVDSTICVLYPELWEPKKKKKRKK